MLHNICWSLFTSISGQQSILLWLLDPWRWDRSTNKSYITFQMTEDLNCTMAEVWNLAGFSNMKNGRPWASYCFVFTNEWNRIMIFERDMHVFWNHTFKCSLWAGTANSTDQTMTWTQALQLKISKIQGQLFVYGFLYAQKTWIKNCEKFFTSMLTYIQLIVQSRVAFLSTMYNPR